jgi:Family of unknown function (DUF5715)
MTERVTTRRLTQRLTRRLTTCQPRRILTTAFLFFALLVSLAAPPSAFAVRRAEHHRRLLSHFRNILRGIPRFLWNPMFRPSHDSLLRQNEEIDRLDLPRIQDDDELEALKASHDLVEIEAGDALRFDPRLDPSRRFCRPWTRDFVADLSEVFYHQFNSQIQVNSAVRTVKMQKKLRRHNRNAAPAEGDTASSHLAGITVDLQRRGMTKDQIHFVERYLFYLKALGLVEPEEERRQWVFHIMVSERYSTWRQTQTIFPHPAVEEPVAPVTATAGTLTDATETRILPQP